MDLKLCLTKLFYRQITYSIESHESNSRNIFHIAPSATHEARALADVVSSFNWKFVNIISSEDSYFSLEQASMEEEFRQRNICVSASVRLFKPRLEAEVRKAITLLKRKQRGRITILLGDTAIAKKVFEEARRQKLNSYLWIGGHAWAGSKDLAKNYADVINGMLGFSLFEKHVVKLRAHLEKFLSGETICNWFNRGNSYQKKCVKTRVLATVKGPMSVRQDVQPTAITIQDTEKSVNSEKLSLAESAKVVDAVYLVAEALREAQMKSEPGSNKNENVTNETRLVKTSGSLLPYLKKAFAKMFSVDENGAIIGKFNIRNLNRNGNCCPDLNSVGTWKYSKLLKSRLSLDRTKISWPGGSRKVPISRYSRPCPPGTLTKKGPQVCCWECKKCPLWAYSATYMSSTCSKCPEKEMPNVNQTGCEAKPVRYLGLGDRAAPVLLVTCVVGEGMTLFVVIVFIKYFNTPVVKASNVIYSFFILFVLLVWFTIPAFYVGRPTKCACAIRVLSPPILYTAVSAALLTKTKRLIRIFSTLKKKHRFLSNAWFAFLTCSLLSVHVLLGMVYLLKFPPNPVTDSSHDDMITVECSQNLPLDATSSVYNAMLCITCAYLAFSSRNLPEHYNEAKHICFVMFVYLVSCAALIFVQYRPLTGKPKTAFSCFVLVVGAYVILFFIFLPKLRVILFRPEKNTRQATLEGTRRYSVDVAANMDMPTFDRGRRHTSPACLPADSVFNELDVCNHATSHVSLGPRLSADLLMRTIDEVAQLDMKVIPIEE